MRRPRAYGSGLALTSAPDTNHEAKLLHAPMTKTNVALPQKGPYKSGKPVSKKGVTPKNGLMESTRRFKTSAVSTLKSCM